MMFVLFVLAEEEIEVFSEEGISLIAWTLVRKYPVEAFGLSNSKDPICEGAINVTVS